jgi:hypothetical protein
MVYCVGRRCNWNFDQFPPSSALKTNKQSPEIKNGSFWRAYQSRLSPFSIPTENGVRSNFRNFVGFLAWHDDQCLKFYLPEKFLVRWCVFNVQAVWANEWELKDTLPCILNKNYKRLLTYSMQNMCLWLHPAMWQLGYTHNYSVGDVAAVPWRYRRMFTAECWRRVGSIGCGSFKGIAVRNWSLWPRSLGVCRP